MSTQLPEKPTGLEFCYWYNDNSCCTSSNEDDIINYFQSAAGGLGAACSPSKHENKLNYWHVREWLCMECDPKEPTYRFLTRQGDIHLGGTTEGDPTAETTDFTWRVCKSFVYGKDGKGGLWGGDGKKYDDCGIKVQTNCEDAKQVYFVVSNNVTGEGEVVVSEQPVLAGWDPYMCGDSAITPSVEYSDLDEPAIAFMTAISPPSFDPPFVVIDDTLSEPKLPCFKGARIIEKAASSGAAWITMSTVTLLVLALL
jgi:hypothetical protein